MSKIKKFNQYINEEMDGSTTGTVGSGMNVGGGAQGSFVSSAGVAVYGGDSSSSGGVGSSGNAYSTLGNSSGMGSIQSPQPSKTPGSVWGKDSISGSGDISKGHLGPFTKLQVSRKKGKQRKENYSTIGANIDNYYKPKYTETTDKSGKLITKWKVFKNK